MVGNSSSLSYRLLCDLENICRILSECYIPRYPRKRSGYQGNYGIIHKGNIKQVIIGRESATETFIDIISGDGDLGYNNGYVNQTLNKGSTTSDHLNTAINSMGAYGITQGYVGQIVSTPLPRGKVMYGATKDILRSIANSTGNGWNIQNEQLNFYSQKSYIPGTAVVLTSKTGLIGTPQQTNIPGVNCKCLLNPFLQVNGRIHIDNKSVADYKVDISSTNANINTPVDYTTDGYYYILVVEHSGDSRGQEWYSTITAVSIDITSSVGNAVAVGAGNG